MPHTQGVDRFNGFAYFSPPSTECDDATVREFQIAGEWFVVAFGKYEDEDKPWVMTVHGKDDVYGLRLMEVGAKDLPSKKVTAPVIEGAMDGQAVYSIDLEIEDAQGPKRKDDFREGRART
ncbi:hypothetical protein F5B21DRAFT_500363 [Xylaria acuta]|nr:hypothetical protein F5B21DRAFT_500363 [Xylaria acuta]